MADNFFCLDIGEKYTKVVDASKKNDLIEVSSIGRIETVSTFYTADVEKIVEEQSAAISQLVSSVKVSKKNVNVVIPGSFTYSQILTMPLLNEKELISAIKYQADRFIPMPIEETNIDLEVIEEYKEEKKILILIVAAPKKLIEKVQNAVELAGLIPEAVENELSASARFVNGFGKNLAAKSTIIANFGLNSTNLSYFENDGQTVKESHSFAIGYQLFLKEIQINTDSDAKKGAEILQTFDMKSKSSYPVDVIASPLIKEFGNELKRFMANKKVDVIYIFNQVYLFPALVGFMNAEVAIKTLELNPYNFTSKNPLVESHRNELSLFISSLGGNLR
jgi:type IV pilus assembly protein PilM